MEPNNEENKELLSSIENARSTYSHVNKWVVLSLFVIAIVSAAIFTMRTYKLTIPIKFQEPESVTLTKQTWGIFQDFLRYAHEHNLPEIRAISHQISETCNNPDKEKECFAIMDNVYNLASGFLPEEFKNIQFDNKQIILYTDGPNVTMLFFTRNTEGTPKILGMRFCSEAPIVETIGTSTDQVVNEIPVTPCVEQNPAKRDLDGNGWWDSVESLFYSTKI